MTTISGYLVGEEVYASSNTRIYRGRQIADGQPVILKMLKQVYPTPEEIAWFTREYELTRALQVPGIIRAYRLLTDQHRHVMVLEDFGGVSLDRLIRQQPMDLAKFLPLAVHITAILGRMHQQHVTHKDINPANLILNPTTGQVKLIDFGLATALLKENPTQRPPHGLEGTLAYMSPEQTGRMNRAIDYRTDFYSLGVTFYELLTGQLPFPTNDVLALVHAHLAQDPQPPHVLNPRVPYPLSALVLKLMAKNAEDRYQSAAGLHADLKYCLQQWQTAGTIAPLALGQHDATDRLHLPQKLYGREAEREVLLATFDRVRQGASEMLLVSGYAGIGKSALVQEIAKPMTQQRGYFVAGKFDPFQRTTPYASFTQAFRVFIKQLLTEDAARLAAWRDAIRAALGANAQVIIDVIPEVELLIGPQAAAAVLPPAEAHNRFIFVFQNFLRVFLHPEHPLVLFLDDLQWADTASLDVLHHVMTAADTRYLLLIGAYRDNEIGATHPLQRMVEAIRKVRHRVPHLTLGPLSLPNVRRWLEDAFNCPFAHTEPLASLVLAKTHGNPFFMGEFVKMLYTEGLLTFDSQHRTWQWDVARIQAQQITDNVVTLMAEKMRKLSQKTQQVVKLAACIGSRFDLQTLAMICETSLRETATNLWEALAEGLVVPLDDAYQLMDLQIEGLAETMTVSYMFAHDRIQQAAYSLIPEVQQPAIQWRLGQLLLQKTAAEERDKHIFTITNHLNLGMQCLDSQEERDCLAAYNLLAGRKAKASAAYGPALDYFQVGVGLLGNESWQRAYDLTLDLYVEAAEAAYLNGDYTRMQLWLTSVLHSADTLLDKIRAYEISLTAAMAQHQALEGLQRGRYVLELLATRLPESPSQTDILQALEETKRSLTGQSIEELVDRPAMTDPYMLAAMRILALMSHFTYISDPKLFPFVILRMVNLSMIYGYTSLSARAYATYGLLLCGIAGDIEAGYQFGQLALQLAERLQVKELKAAIYFVVSQFIRHWKEHIGAYLAFDLEGYHSGLETGNLNYAAFCAFGYLFNAFWSGKNLTTLDQEMTRYNGVIRSIKQRHALHLSALYQQAVLNLQGQSDTPYHLVGTSYHEEIMLQQHLGENDRNAIGFMAHMQLFLCYLFQEYRLAAEHAALFAEYMDGVISTALIPSFYYYDSLTKLAMVRDVKESASHGLLAQVAANQDKMLRWAQHAPMNYLHKFYLVEAERARVRRQYREAREHYDYAIDLARQHAYIIDEAQAHELAAQYYLGQGQARLAFHYMRDAHYAYIQWGATAKVKHLESRYQELLIPGASSGHCHTFAALPTTSGKHNASALDITSVLRAAQAIASEIVFDKLLDKLMHIMIENAGAQRGCLILDKAGTLVIEAERMINRADVITLQSVPVETRHDLPLTLIRYVQRTKDDVVLNEALQDSVFTTDTYMTTKRPQSILCMPLLHQGELSGLLYLENALMPGVFTPERLEVLKVLASQAAIAIENARLYSTLEQRVGERTQELLKKNEELERTKQAAEAANRAKSTFLANMSHEIRTPLNAILGYAHILTRDMDLNTRQVSAVQTIAHNGRHLLNLINDVLDLSKIEAGRMELQAIDFDLTGLIDEIAETFTMRCKEKELCWRVEWTMDGNTDQCVSAPPSRLVVHGDEGKLRQVLINLLSNAVKFTTSGEVVLRIHLPQATTRVSHTTFHVIDTGIGIAAEDQAKIFHAFDQVVSAERREGTGLGLTIAYKHVALMGGHLAVESTLGVGSRFFFTLPLTPQIQQEVEQRARRDTILHLPEGVSVRALVVDDVADNRAILTYLLHEVGVEVQTLDAGTQVLAHLALAQPDIVFMDIRMPLGDGVSVAQRIIAKYDHNRPKLVAVSASALSHERERYFAAGFDDFIAKPIAPDQLYQCLSRLLRLQFVTKRLVEETVGASAIVLPMELYEGIKQAAETYRVSQLDRYFDTIAQLGPSGQRLAECLRQSKQDGDMHGIIQLLSQQRQAEEGKRT